MCGRVALHTSPTELAELFSLDEIPRLQPRFNLAPTQPIALVRWTEGQRTLSLFRWGLIPPWARPGGPPLFNARLDTASSKPSFREAFRKRRALIPINGFFEWERQQAMALPYFVCRRSRSPFALAGLWERWRAPEGHWVESCTVLTQPARPPVDSWHDRCPVVIQPAAYADWLDPSLSNPGKALVETWDDSFVAFRVGLWVNRVANDDPRCIEPLLLLSLKP